MLEPDAPKTKQGNIKIPHTMEISDWVAEWTTTLSKENIKKAFTKCGIVPVNEYAIENLHQPLQTLLNDNTDLEQWIADHKDWVPNNTMDVFEILIQNWFCPDDSDFTFLNCLQRYNNKVSLESLGKKDDSAITLTDIEDFAKKLQIKINVLELNRDFFVEKETILNEECDGDLVLKFPSVSNDGSN